MKKTLLLSLVIMLFSTSLFSQVAINKDGSSPDPSAMLDVKSTTGGLLIPRLTEQEMVNIASPSVGLLIYVYDIQDGAIMYFSNVGWTKLAKFNSIKPFSKIEDQDYNTMVEVEKSINEDKIRFTLDGIEYFTMDKGRLEFLNTGGSVFIGEGAGENDDLSSNRNTFVGYWSGLSNVGGINNTAVGNYSLKSNTSGSSNIAIGEDALVNNATGNSNIAIGEDASYYNTTGHSNVSIGIRALFNNTEKSNIVAIGDSALYYNGANAIGLQAAQNIAIGSKALFNNTKGYKNTSIGYKGLYANIEGNNNTSIGSETLLNNYADGNTAIGSSSMKNNSGGDYNTAIGSQSLISNTLGKWNIAIGSNAMNNNQSGNYNVALGVLSLYSNVANSNTAIGNEALNSNTQGNSNVAIGVRALYKNTNKSNLVAIGDSALFNNGTGSTTSDHGALNTAVGSKSLFSNTIGYSNTSIGNRALHSNTTGGYNIAIGSLAQYFNSSGSRNISVGDQALALSTTGSNNVALGMMSGFTNNGSDNVFIGHMSGKNETGSNKLYISNSDTVKPLIYGDFSSHNLEFNGSVRNNHYMEFFNSGNTRTISIYPSGDGSASGSGLITLHDANGTATIQIDGDYNGDGRIITNELQITGGSDLSEFFNLSDYANIKKGMVVSIDEEIPGNLIVSTEAYDRKVAGIVSGANNIKPGLIMSQKGTIADGEHLIALTGRVYCMVDATNSPTEVGDMLTTSSIPGHAMKVNDFDLARGAIIGKAMTSLKSGTGLVLVLVSLQ